MREDSSSLEYDDPHQENFYNLTLSSKINTGGMEMSGSRSKRTTMIVGGSNQRRHIDTMESVISTIPSVKHNRKQPLLSLVPSTMNKHTG